VSSRIVAYSKELTPRVPRIKIEILLHGIIGEKTVPVSSSMRDKFFL
jgi:hypothetical protein